jgi:crystallin alpha B
MSLVPLLFRDWWDDFDRDRPSRLLDQHFGVGLKRDDLFNSLSSLSTPLIRPGRYFRPWAESLARSNSGSSNIQVDEKQFQVILDVQQFAPNEITVKVSDGCIVVEGKHNEKRDEHGFISRHFVRRYTPPKDVDIDNVVSSLSSDGVLTISVPKKIQAIAGDRVVPVIQTGAPAIKPSTESPIKIEQQKPSNETQIKIEQEGN